MVKKLAITLAILTVIGAFAALFFPATSAIIATGVWAFIIASIVIFCVSIFMLFVFAGIGALILSAIAVVWGIIAIVLFPFLFPIILPLLLIFIFISIIRRRQSNKPNKDHQKVLNSEHSEIKSTTTKLP